MDPADNSLEQGKCFVRKAKRKNSQTFTDDIFIVLFIYFMGRWYKTIFVLTGGVSMDNGASTSCAN
jgi:hypothetical protein